MKNLKIILFLIVLIIVSGCSNTSSKYDTFAKCLTEKGVVMYGTDWCSHCQNQKEMFGYSFQFIEYINCDKSKEVCLEKGIRGYPTWIINGKVYAGEQRLEKLAELSGCDLVKDSD